MNKDNFKTKITMYLFNFDFEAKGDYIKLIWNTIKDKTTDEDFNKAIENLLIMTSAEYFDTYCGKRLAIGDWLFLCNIKKSLLINSSRDELTRIK